MELASGDRVRLVRAESGMAAGATGTLIGWYRHHPIPLALVNFWDGGPLRVPADAIESAKEPRTNGSPNG